MPFRDCSITKLYFIVLRIAIYYAPVNFVKETAT
ncbi:hypothetical protein PUN4_700018 [Paraburkholderia unamae]|nr:hypothetical protein PUN4_700018 [Paraburkholderia unamae]